MIELQEIFHIEYPQTLVLSQQNLLETGIPFVSSKGKNNGVSARVEPNEKNKLYNKGSITVPLKGTILHAFLQPNDFYCAHQIAVLTSKIDLTIKQKLFYCLCIQNNKYRYNYGRQADKTLRTIRVPHPDDILAKANAIAIPQKPSAKSVSKKQLSLNDRKWLDFKYDNIFTIHKGFYNKKPDEVAGGDIPFIGATEYDNGVTSWHDLEKIEKSSKTGSGKNHDLRDKVFEGGKYITVSNNGSTGYAFFHTHKFTCSHDVNPITTKSVAMNPYIAMFLATLIELERYRWDYGRKWRPARMPQSTIKLPINASNEPDWQFMEDYIKSLPYSVNLEED